MQAPFFIEAAVVLPQHKALLLADTGALGGQGGLFIAAPVQMLWQRDGCNPCCGAHRHLPRRLLHACRRVQPLGAGQHRRRQEGRGVGPPGAHHQGEAEAVEARWCRQRHPATCRHRLSLRRRTGGLPCRPDPSSNPPNPARWCSTSIPPRGGPGWRRCSGASGMSSFLPTPRPPCATARPPLPPASTSCTLTSEGPRAGAVVIMRRPPQPRCSPCRDPFRTNPARPVVTASPCHFIAAGSALLSRTVNLTLPVAVAQLAARSLVLGTGEGGRRGAATQRGQHRVALGNAALQGGAVGAAVCSEPRCKRSHGGMAAGCVQQPDHASPLPATPAPNPPRPAPPLPAACRACRRPGRPRPPASQWPRCR